MIYFSAHWCPPCRGYTPQLASTYSSSTKLDEVEIIFVSSDQDQAAFDGYHGEMPWLALPYSDRAAKDKLSELYGVRGIPTLVVLNADGTVVTTGGRGKESTWLGGGGGGGGDSSGGGNTGSGCVIL
jgi:nucleoredoxin